MIPRFPVPTAATAVFLALVTQAVLAQAATTHFESKPLPADRAAGAATVGVADCQRWLGTLAGKEFEGRGTGQPGYEKAANYVADHFKALGLEARGENGSYFQTVPWQMTAVVAAKTSIEFRRGETVLHTIPAERLLGTATANADTSGSVVLLRPKLVPTKPAEGGEGNRRRGGMEVEGLADLDLKGKVVLVSMPPAGEGQQAAAQQAAMARFSVTRALQGKECAAVLYADTEPVQGGLRGRGGMGRGGGNRAASGAARSPLDATFGGDDFAAVLKALQRDVGSLAEMPVMTATDLTAHVRVAVEEKQAPAMNVFAVLPGSDPKLKDEYVVIGSHLDHLGKAGDVIRPGADDDGSGTTGVMAAAQMFARNPTKPARSVLFVCFSGEESGLVGSAWFADHCPIPLASIVAELQMDMIGRDEEENSEGDKGELAENNRNSLHLIGTKKLAPALHELCMAKNQTALFDLEWDQEGMFGRSDHANFARYGVPIAFFFTGLHKDYHQPSDTPDKINYPKLLRVATYVYDIGFELGTSSGRPEIDPELWTKYRGKKGEKPAAPLAPAKAEAPTKTEGAK